jgi:ankyrin repeat protein
MLRVLLLLTLLLSTASSQTSDATSPSVPTFDYRVAYAHELKPHRRTIPMKGVQAGFNQLHLRITVSPTGDVLDVHPTEEVDPQPSDGGALKFRPQLEREVRQWKFTPFEQNGNPVTAEIDIDLVPPERLPKTHVAPPVLRSNSKVAISLQRSGCFGSCPSYTVTVSTDGIVFEGGYYVVARGRHTAGIDPKTVRKLASRFVATDFYSMEPKYVASVTDNSTYVLSIDIDGHKKTVEDYVGSWEGMPAVISDLEQEVDDLAKTERWIEGNDGLVPLLQAEKFSFQSTEAQTMLKEAASRGRSDTVRELVAAGVPLDPLPEPHTKDRQELGPDFRASGLLASASGNFQTLQILLDSGASRNDQKDKDLALAGAARSGNVEAARALLAYGANPNSDFSKLLATENAGGMTIQGPGVGSVLIEAASSGNPDMVKEILRYHPNLEARGYEGKTAMFAAGEYRSSDKEGARVECVRLLAQAGADVNARDHSGNTPLHEIYLTYVEEELLKLGADVNARNKDGETPIFTNVNADSVALFIQYGADLTIRNNQGQDVVEADNYSGPERKEALRKALQSLVQKK